MPSDNAIVFHAERRTLSTLQIFICQSGTFLSSLCAVENCSRNRKSNGGKKTEVLWGSFGQSKMTNNVKRPTRWRIHGKFPKSTMASLVQMSSARPQYCSALPKPSLLDGFASVCHFLYRTLSASSSATLCPNIRHSAALKESSPAMSA